MILFLIGLAAGTISGMGMGGGAILIPALVLATNPEQHIAQSVNLLFFVPTAVIALVIHIKNKQIDFKMAWPIIISGLCGAFLGSLLAARLGGGQLKKLFGFFLLAMSIYEMFRKGKQEKHTKHGNQEKQENRENR
ncbi:MAG TPA: sulfite exporter TauE/SafE family protein [Clostridia bacterium]|nr:sulfite exporter TauE/SafE family protein [Clostridia bacterium]